jgi:hypothetical protein
MITPIPDAVSRLTRQFGIESRHDTKDNLLEPLQNGEPYTPANMAEIELAVAAWKPLSLAATPNPFPYASGTTITVRSATDVADVALLVGGVPATVTLTNGVGTLTIAPLQSPTLPPHRLVVAQNQAVFGYATLTLEAV